MKPCPSSFKIEKLLNSLFFVTIIFSLFSITSYSQILQESKLYGITIDGVYPLSDIKSSISSHPRKMTTRIVFDEFIPASDYINACTQLHTISYIMGELLDSYYMDQYSLEQYNQRANEYLNTLGSKVDIWEVGNEVNGEWLGSTSGVIAKIQSAYNIFHNAGKVTAITLYYNWNCWSNPQNEMFRWVNLNIPDSMKQNLNYVFVSYYEDDCNGYQPNWQRVFDSLHVIFPNSKLGIGECGTVNNGLKAEYMKRYYNLKISTPNYVGGYFWWYYRQDCVPKTKALWTTFNNILSYTRAPGNPSGNLDIITYNYPNPFNPMTTIYYETSIPGQVQLSVYDAEGSVVSDIINEFQDAGKHSVKFDGANLSSGIYFYRIYLKSSNPLILGNTVNSKIVLIK